MATFAQFVRVPRSPKVSWVCGPDRVLVCEVVDQIVSRSAASVFEKVRYDAMTDPVAAIWAGVNQYPSVPGADRLVVVYGADRIRDFSPVIEFLATSRRLPGTRVILVSDSEAFPVTREGDHPEYLEKIRARGSIVRATGTDADLSAFVKVRVPEISSEALRALVSTADSGVIRDCLDVHRGLGITPSAQTVRALVRPTSASGYVTALIERRIPDSLAAASDVPAQAVSAVLGRISAIVGYMEVMYPAVISGQPVWQVMSKGVPEPVARRYFPAAKHYDAGARARSRSALAAAADAGGFGPLEVLAGLW